APRKNQDGSGGTQAGFDLNAHVPAADAMMFVSAIIQSAKEIITDGDTFRRVSDRMLQLLPPA
ncbi:MAG TPA: hypothetical protein DDY78_14665, partial [Planctomycetales bacterium]|nr:hypothetical protein [Planctomycetales bacterium]